MKLWFMRESLTRYRSLKALAVQMTKHLCLNMLRNRGRQREGLQRLSSLSDNTTPILRYPDKDMMEQAMRIIDTLPGLQQAVLRMKHLEGLEVEEIATLTGSTPEAVRMNLSRARRKVREYFEQ